MCEINKVYKVFGYYKDSVLGKTFGVVHTLPDRYQADQFLRILRNADGYYRKLTTDHWNCLPIPGTAYYQEAFQIHSARPLSPQEVTYLPPTVENTSNWCAWFADEKSTESFVGCAKTLLGFLLKKFSTESLHENTTCKVVGESGEIIVTTTEQQTLKGNSIYEVCYTYKYKKSHYLCKLFIA